MKTRQRVCKRCGESELYGGIDDNNYCRRCYRIENLKMQLTYVQSLELEELLSSPEKKEEVKGMIWNIGKEGEKKLKNKVLQTATREELIGYIEELESKVEKEEPTQELGIKDILEKLDEIHNTLHSIDERVWK